MRNENEKKRSAESEAPHHPEYRDIGYPCQKGKTVVKKEIGKRRRKEYGGNNQGGEINEK